jgi:hypothetical protein
MSPDRAREGGYVGVLPACSDPANDRYQRNLMFALMQTNGKMRSLADGASVCRERRLSQPGIGNRQVRYGPLRPFEQIQVKVGLEAIKAARFKL